MKAFSREENSWCASILSPLKSLLLLLKCQEELAITSSLDSYCLLLSIHSTEWFDRILLPPKQFLTIPSLEWYKIPGYNSVSPELILSVLSTPNWISSEQELHLWYGEDLVNFSEEDNGGTVCVNVYALFVWKEAVFSRRCSTGWKKCHEEKEN